MELGWDRVVGFCLVQPLGGNKDTLKIHIPFPVFPCMPMQENKKRKRFEHTPETQKIKDAISATNYLLVKHGLKIVMYWSRDAVAMCTMEPQNGQKSWNQASGAWGIVVKIQFFELSKVGV